MRYDDDAGPPSSLPADSANMSKGTAMTDSSVPSKNEAAPRPPYPNQDWTEIRTKSTVEVRYPSGYAYQAIVDEKSLDSRIVWVLSTNGHGRKMYCNWDGVELRNRATINESHQASTP